MEDWLAVLLIFCFSFPHVLHHLERLVERRHVYNAGTKVVCELIHAGGKILSTPHPAWWHPAAQEAPPERQPAPPERQPAPPNNDERA